VRARWLVAIFVVAGGCYHYPHEELLKALAGEPGTSFHWNPQPKYIGFSDDRTEFVFKPVATSAGYVIALDGSILICPGVPAEGPHGYVLRADVDTVMGDSAIVTLVQTCIREPGRCPSGSESCMTLNSGVNVTGTNYLLVRRNKVWTLEIALSGATVING
jgi:hypothetical protein